MQDAFKPAKYNSLSPYLLVNGAGRLATLLKTVFDAEELRNYSRPDGTVMHLELKLDDSVLMLSDATPEYPAAPVMLHMYVPDVHHTFQRAIENGCEIIEKPVRKTGDPDIRGAFRDPAGNYWAVSTQAS